MWSKICIGIHVKYTLFWSHFNESWIFSTWYSNILTNDHTNESIIIVKDMIDITMVNINVISDLIYLWNIYYQMDIIYATTRSSTFKGRASSGG